ncbi:hypothetical protein HWV07_15720 [Natronomonas salina]|uniref:hypothetical protein n=1 Tax=Natronomonas salina TaxID=1710540 RepID=UPI0015B591DD|nr:hypothetical protein [Natronomonas salina]QLD90404.1 hypothetical protein HWV07_15720 [Natronomonas salina]
MGRLLQESLYGLIFVVCVVATLLATVAFLAPTVLPEPFATAAAESHIWIVATASLTILGMLFALLVLRRFV